MNITIHIGTWIIPATFTVLGIARMIWGMIADLPTATRSSIGIYEQLRQCSTFDLDRQQMKHPLDMDQLFESIYAIKRHREKNP